MSPGDVVEINNRVLVLHYKTRFYKKIGVILGETTQYNDNYKWYNLYIDNQIVEFCDAHFGVSQ